MEIEGAGDFFNGLPIALVRHAFFQGCEGVAIALEKPVLDHAIFFDSALVEFPEISPQMLPESFHEITGATDCKTRFF